MKSLIRSLMDGDPIEETQTRTISAADSTEQAERRKLVAYCDKCEDWWKFVRDMSPNPGEELCPSCGGKPSARHGYQPTTQRTFNPKAKKLTKAQLKKMGTTGA